MNLGGVFEDLQQIWEEQPGTIVLLLLGLAVFVYLVVDTWRHRRHRCRRGKPR